MVRTRHHRSGQLAGEVERPAAAVQGHELRYDRPNRRPVYAVYVEASAPTIVAVPAPRDPAFSIGTAGARFEAAAWSVGNFVNTGTGILGGSVFVEPPGTAKIAGGGGLKAFTTLPSGSPSFYGLDTAASEYG
jgi:hypothetical protein